MPALTLQFEGAARTVTGSRHHLRWGERAWLFDCGLYQGRPVRVGVAVHDASAWILERNERQSGVRDGLGEGRGRQGHLRQLRASARLDHEQRQRDEHQHRRHESGACRHRRGGRALTREPRVEPAPEVGRWLDGLDVLQRSDPAAQRRVVAAAGSALHQVPLETPQLSRGGHKAVAELGIPVEEFLTDHNG